MDKLQHETQEGPCLSSIEQQGTFRIPDMENDFTWPTFSRRAAEETDTLSMLSIVLKVTEKQVTALNLISSKKDAFDEDDEIVGAVFAAQAQVAILNAQTHAADQAQIGQLKEAIQTREIIGQAVGLIMANRDVDGTQAFAILKQISQNANVKLKEIAARVIEKSSEI